MIYEVLNRMDGYLTERYSVRDLEAWLVSNLQGILDSGDKKAVEVANQVDADLVELGEGLIDETGLRERLERYLRFAETVPAYMVEIEDSASAHSTAVAETVWSRLESPTLVMDLHLEHVFG